jgi:hypothetical protein
MYRFRPIQSNVIMQQAAAVNNGLVHQDDLIQYNRIFLFVYLFMNDE